MTVLARKDSGSFVRMPNTKGLRCMSYEDTLREMEAFLDGKLDNPQSANEVYADITEPITSSAIRLPDSEDPVATENSSSFGDTASRSDNVSGNSDAEVESEFRDDTGLGSMLDSYDTVLPIRKKKLTNHWRSFIRPLMWRCKWTEIKIKELESQALKYSSEIEANDQAKMLEVHQHKPEFCSKSSPYIYHSKNRKPMKRRKRKLVESVADISSYVSHHQIFSYLENKKVDVDGSSTVDDAGNLDSYDKNDEFGVDDDWLKEDEESFEQILRQIDTVQSQVQRLRNHLDMVMLKNGVKFSSSENLSLLAAYDAETSAAQSPAFSAGNGDNMSIRPIFVSSEHLADFEIDDLVLPEISGYGDGTQIPDIIESTVGLLSEEDVTIHHQQIMESGENTLDDSMIQNQVRDGRTPNGVDDQPIDGYQNPENIQQNVPSLIVGETVAVDTMSMEKSTVKSCLTSDIQDPRVTRKQRGERKKAPGAIGWNMRSSGEPDSS